MTLFVAQCYDYVNLDLVEGDYELCTPDDILKSKILTPVDNPILKATQEDIDFAQSKDVTQLQYESIKKFLLSLKRKFPDEDIVSLNQLEDFIERNPSNGDCVLELLKQTDYFDLWRIEKGYCPYNYDADELKNKWKDNAAKMAIFVKKESERIIDEKQRNITAYEHRIESIGDIGYYREMIALQKNIIEAASERIVVAEQVLKDLGVVKIKLPWC